MTAHTPKKILVVDDDETFLHIITRRLAAANYEIATAGTRESFIEQATRFQPDLIILDIMLGKDNGAAVLDDLNKQGLLTETPVIFMSSLTEDEPPQYIPNGRKVIMHSKFVSEDVLLREIETMTLRV